MIADGIALEQTVIGHALNDQTCFQLFIAEVQWEYFSASNHQVIAFCMRQMAQLGIRKPDEDSFQLVVNGFPKDDKDYGGVQYLRSLKEAFKEPSDNYEQFTSRLRINAAKARIGSERVQTLVKLANNPLSTIAEIRNVVKAIALDIELSDSSDYGFKDMTQLGEEYITELTDRQGRQFYTTGFDELDRRLAEGFAPKQITVLAGFTGMAKSTVAINMAHRIAVAGIGVALFSMESTSVSMVDKLISTLTQIPLNKLKKETAKLDERERNFIRVTVEQIKALPLLINDNASMSIDGMLYQLQSAQRRGYDPKVIFIDLFGKIEDVDTGDNLANRIQRECKRMRVLAKELAVHFVLVVQLNREGYGRGRMGGIKRPSLVHIKNSNAYAEEANIVLLTHRNKYYMPELENDILEIEIAKQRDGEQGVKVYFEMRPETSTITGTQLRPHDIT